MGPTRRREMVFENESSLTWVDVIRAVEGGVMRAIAGDDEEGKESTMDPMFDMTISH